MRFTRRRRLFCRSLGTSHSRSEYRDPVHSNTMHAVAVACERESFSGLTEEPFATRFEHSVLPSSISEKEKRALSFRSDNRDPCCRTLPSRKEKLLGSDIGVVCLRGRVRIAPFSLACMTWIRGGTRARERRAPSVKNSTLSFHFSFAESKVSVSKALADRCSLRRLYSVSSFCLPRVSRGRELSVARFRDFWCVFHIRVPSVLRVCTCVVFALNTQCLCTRDNLFPSRPMCPLRVFLFSGPTFFLLWFFLGMPL